MPENAPTNTEAADEGITPENTLHGVVLDAEKDNPRVLFTLKDNAQLERRLGELMDDNLLVEPVRRELFVRLKLLVGKDMVSNTRREELEKNTRALGHILETCEELTLRFKSVTTAKGKVPVFELTETLPGINEARMDEALAFVEAQDEQARNPAPLTAARSVKKPNEPVSQTPAHDTQPIASVKGDTGVILIDPKTGNPPDPKDPQAVFRAKKFAMEQSKLQRDGTSSGAAARMLKERYGGRIS